MTTIFFDKRTNKTYIRTIISINSKLFAENVYNQGLKGKRNYNTSFPNIEESYYSSFIRGLFDGDGCITKGSKNCRRIQFIATKPIVEFISKLFLKKFNIKLTKFSLLSKNHSGELLVYHIYNKVDVIKIMNYLYEFSTIETRLNRKFIIFQEYKKRLEEAESKKIIYSFIKDGIIISSNNLSELSKKYNLTTTYLKDIWNNKRSHHKGWIPYHPN